MGATITQVSNLPQRKKLSKKMKDLRQKLLNGPTMTQQQIKYFEKQYSWRKKLKD